MKEVPRPVRDLRRLAGILLPALGLVWALAGHREPLDAFSSDLAFRAALLPVASAAAALRWVLGTTADVVLGRCARVWLIWVVAALGGVALAGWHVDGFLDGVGELAEREGWCTH